MIKMVLFHSHLKTFRLPPHPASIKRNKTLSLTLPQIKNRCPALTASLLPQNHHLYKLYIFFSILSTLLFNVCNIFFKSPLLFLYILYNYEYSLLNTGDNTKGDKACSLPSGQNNTCLLLFIYVRKNYNLSNTKNISPYSLQRNRLYHIFLKLPS